MRGDGGVAGEGRELLVYKVASRKEQDISLSIVNSKARFYTHASRAYYQPIAW